VVVAAAAAIGRRTVAAVVTGPAKAASYAVEVAAVVVGVGRLIGVGRLAAAAVVLDGNATSAFPDKSIQSYLHQYELTEALFLAPWHGT
jgi:hypothetical protein